MLITDIFIWLIAYAAFLVLSAVIINGLHITTRGDEETMPDGSTEVVHAMIFHFFYRWIMRTNGTRRVYYTGTELSKLHNRIITTKPLPRAELIDLFDIKFFNGRSADALSLWNQYAVDQLDKEDIKIETELQFPTEVHREKERKELGITEEQAKEVVAVKYPIGIIRFYKEYDLYVFPVWVRKPVVDCIKCMPSVWGTLIYWTTVLIAFPFDWKMFPLWIAYCFSLSYVNTFLYSKAH